MNAVHLISPSYLQLDVVTFGSLVDFMSDLRQSSQVAVSGRLGRR